MMITQADLPLFDQEVYPWQRVELSTIELAVTKLIYHANREAPLMNADLREKLSYEIIDVPSEREIKAIIRSLRRDHQFPILSSRVPPCGYWWCSSADEMREWAEAFRQQPMDELVTAAKVVKANYPELVGQLKLEFFAGQVG